MATKVETGELLALICKVARERYHEDITAPGVQVAHVTKPEGNFWYVALHRYLNSTSSSGNSFAGTQRTVVVSAERDDLDVALGILAETFVPVTDVQHYFAKALK